MAKRYKHSIFDKFIDVLVILLIISLLTGSVLILYPLLKKAKGQPTISQEEKLDDNTIISITQPIRIKLNDLYQNNPHKEFAVCMYGYDFNESHLIINKIEEVYVVNATEEDITFKECTNKNNLLGYLHSHPASGSCELSNADIYSFGKIGTLVSAVMCDIDKFGFYSKNSLSKSLKYQVILY